MTEGLTERRAGDRRSSDRRRADAERRLPPLERVGVGGVAGAGATVRPARLDRQLGRGQLNAGFVDEHLEQLVSEAAEQAREAARAEGYSAGWAQGRQAAAEQAQAASAALAQRAAEDRAAEARRLRALMLSLGEAARTVRAERLPDWTEVADLLADGALQLASAALGRELRSVDSVVADSVRAALRALAEPTEAVVYLHPTDATLVDEPATPGVRVMADPSVPPGSLVALTPAQRLRMDLPAALAAAEEVLRS